MKVRYIILPLVLIVGLSLVYLLPSAGSIAQSAVKMDLPDLNGAWHFKKIPPSTAEVETLAKDTEFSKAMCLRARPGEYDMDGNILPDRLDLSVVLSGADINNSIHRPERCMPAQGHQIAESTNVVVPLENGKKITAKRLKSVQRISTDANGGRLEFKCVTYYFFVGHDKITNDHLQRTLIDMKDRLIRGMDQRWAYVSVSMWYGELPWMKGTEISEQEVDEKLANFVALFAKEQIDWDQLKL